MRELKKLRGEQVEVSGSNAVNDIRELYPGLFPYQDMEELYVEFPSEIQISITSSDNVDTDYKVLKAGVGFDLYAVTFSNIKIKSATSQTGYIYTAGI